MNTVANYDLKIKKRIQLVHIAANELGLIDPKKHETDPDDKYHLILRRWNRPGTRQPVTSSTQMNYAQLGELLDFFKTLGFKLRSGSHTKPRSHEEKPKPAWKKYESSLAGLKDEICNLAWVRWGGIKPGPGVSPDSVWESPLNNFCQRFGVKRWQWLDVAHGKEVKNAILRLNCEGQKAFATEGTENGEEPIPF